MQKNLSRPQVSQVPLEAIEHQRNESNGQQETGAFTEQVERHKNRYEQQQKTKLESIGAGSFCFSLLKQFLKLTQNANSEPHVVFSLLFFGVACVCVSEN
jgi:hypothetical protein